MEEQPAGNITFAPGFTSANYPDGLAGCSIDDQIQAFENMYSVWILPFAQKLVEMPDSGFATLTLLNAYPDMIAQMHGYNDQSHTAKQRYTEALEAIFPEIKNASVKDRSVSEHLYKFLRSGLAHMSFTSVGIMLSEVIGQPIWLTEFQGQQLICVNPRKWLERIEVHFREYLNVLRNPENKQHRQTFSARLLTPF